MGAHALEAGLQIDRYELVRRVAVGGMGEVWIARKRGSHGFEKFCAFKTLQAGMTGDAQLRQTLADEARLAARIEHPNVAGILDVGECAVGPYVVIELVDGESVAALCKSFPHAFPIGIVLRIGQDMCAGLHAAHELRDASGTPLGVVHRDVSPHNVLVSVNGEVKMIDFGIALASDRSRDTALGEVKGKLNYMAPEQLKGVIDRRSDIWAIGAVLYRLLAGRAPLQGDNTGDTLQNLMRGAVPAPLPAAVDPRVAAVIMRALAMNPEDRFASARAFAKGLREAARAMGVDDSANVLMKFVRQNMSSGARALRMEVGFARLDEGVTLDPSMTVDDVNRALEENRNVERSASPAHTRLPDTAPSSGTLRLATAPPPPPAESAARAPFGSEPRLPVLPTQLSAGTAPKEPVAEKAAQRARRANPRVAFPVAVAVVALAGLLLGIGAASIVILRDDARDQASAATKPLPERELGVATPVAVTSGAKSRAPSPPPMLPTLPPEITSATPRGKPSGGPQAGAIPVPSARVAASPVSVNTARSSTTALPSLPPPRLHDPY